jgi:hypothetical protein
MQAVGEAPFKILNPQEQQAASAISYPFTKFSEGAKWVGEKAESATGVPYVAPVTQGLSEFAAIMFGGKVAEKVTRPLKELPMKVRTGAMENLLNDFADLAKQSGKVATDEEARAAAAGFLNNEASKVGGWDNISTFKLWRARKRFQERMKEQGVAEETTVGTAAEEPTVPVNELPKPTVEAKADAGIAELDRQIAEDVARIAAEKAAAPEAAPAPAEVVPDVQPEPITSNEIPGMFGGVADAVTANFYQGLYDALGGAKNAMATNEKATLSRMKPYYDAGLITGPHDIQRFENSGYPELPTQQKQEEVKPDVEAIKEEGKQETIAEGKGEGLLEEVEQPSVQNLNEVASKVEPTAKEKRKAILEKRKSQVFETEDAADDWIMQQADVDHPDVSYDIKPVKGGGFKVVRATSKQLKEVPVTKVAEARPDDVVTKNDYFLDADAAKQQSAMYAGRKITDINTAFAKLRAEVNDWYHTGKGDVDQMENHIAALAANYKRAGLSPSDEVSFADSIAELGTLFMDMKRLKSQAGFVDLTDLVKVTKKLAGIVKGINWSRHTIEQKHYDQFADGLYQYQGKAALSQPTDVTLFDDGNKMITKKPEARDVPLLKTIFGHAYLEVKDVPLSKILSLKTIMAERRTGHAIERDTILIDKLESGISEKDAEAVQQLGFKVMEVSKKFTREVKAQMPDMSDADLRVLKDAYVRDYVEKASVSPAVRDTYKQMRKYYDGMQDRHRVQMYKDLVRGLKYGEAIRDAYLAGDIENLFTRAGITHVAHKQKARAEANHFIQQIKKIEEWGDEDYFPHLMVGDIKLVDMTLDEKGHAAGKTITIAVDEKSALEAAKMYMADNPGVTHISIEPRRFDEYDLPQAVGKKKFGVMVGKMANALKKLETDLNGLSPELKATEALGGAFTIDPHKPFAAPLERRRDIIPGEKNPFVAMRAYSRAVNRYIEYSDVVEDMRRHVDQLPKNVRNNLIDALKWSMGSYHAQDRFADEFISTMTAGRWQPHRALTRSLGTMKSLAVNKDMGYRLAPVVQNMAAGFGNIIAEYRVEKIMQAGAWLMTPEGKKFQLEIAPYLSSGILEEAGKMRLAIRTAGSKYKSDWKALFLPMGLFGEAERLIRPVDVATAYLDIRERCPEWGHEGHILWTVDNLLRHQGLGTKAESPRWMRSPVGWSMSLFQRYIGRQVEQFMYNKKSPAYYAEAGIQMIMMTGTRGFIWTARNILGLALIAGVAEEARDWLDQLEQYVMAKYPRSSSGISGYLGRGISMVAQGTTQIPNEPGDLAGAVFLDAIKLARLGWLGVSIPIQLFAQGKTFQHVAADEVPEIMMQLRQFAPTLRPWLENLQAGRADLERIKEVVPIGQGVIQALQDYATTPGGDVLGKDGMKIYKLDWYDKLVNVTGGRVITKEFERLEHQTARGREIVREKQMKAMLGNLKKRINTGHADDISDIVEKFTQIQTKYGPKPEDAGRLSYTIGTAGLTPMQRDLIMKKMGVETKTQMLQMKEEFEKNYQVEGWGR